MKVKWQWIWIGVSVGLFVIRAVIFMSNYGAEHDSGWYLGVARNLANRGIWASYTNTITEEGKGEHPSIHRRFSVQDENGYSYFPAGVTVGPGYIVPEAMIIKVFGEGWWQYQAWPLISYTLLLIGLFALVFNLGGLVSLVVFQVWLWSNPGLTLAFSFESFSESIALLFLLGSILVYFRFNNSLKGMMGAGILASLSFLTKNLFGLNIAVFGAAALVEIISKRKEWKRWIKRWLMFALGILSPILLFEAYRYIYLVSHFGKEGYEAINEDIVLTWKSGGSGITELKNLNPEKMLRKLLIWTEIGIGGLKGPWLILTAFPVVYWIWGRKEKRGLALMIWGSIILSFVWFILLSTDGWARHIWQGLIIGMVLFSVMTGIFITAKKWQIGAWAALALLLFVIFRGVLVWSKSYMGLIVSEEKYVEWKYWPNIRLSQGFPFTAVFSRKDQDETAGFFEQNIKENDLVYYESGFLVAELSPLVDKVFYPLKRYENNNFKNPKGGKSFLIIGPYQKGKWKIVPDSYLSITKKKYCNANVFVNDSYEICELGDYRGSRKN